MPVRAVAARSLRTASEVDGSSVTEYEPGAACSAVWLYGAVVAAGSVPMEPTVGRIGTSPYAEQPGPDMWVRLKPVMAESS